METVKLLITLAGFVGLIVGVYIWVQKLITEAGEKLLQNESFIKSVAGKVKPFLIFNEKGSFLYDGGALQYVFKDGLIIEDFNQEFKPFTVTIRFQCFLPVAPHLESLDCALYQIFPERGEGNSWIYKIKSEMTASDAISEHRFRVEILK